MTLIERPPVELAPDAALRTAVEAAFERNNKETHYSPSDGMYDQNWLWDTAFHAIGLRHINPQRAAKEIESLFVGEWSDGMIANQTFGKGNLLTIGPDYLGWQSKRSKEAPRDIRTSGITQPPVIAEATQLVGEKLSEDDRKAFYQRVVPGLIRYHKWFYDKRQVDDTGLAVMIHSWETGMDNTPPWMEHLKKIKREHPGFLDTLQDMPRVRKFVAEHRRDTKNVNPEQRATLDETMMCFAGMLRLRKLRHDMGRIVEDPRIPLIQDVGVNSILIRNNRVLEELAAEAEIELPEGLKNSMAKTEAGLEEHLWRDGEDGKPGMYYSRDARTGELIEIPTIASLMPFYAGTISDERWDQLLEHLNNKNSFNTEHPIPTVPKNSPFFDPNRYWQGSVWINKNWLVIRGLATRIQSMGRAEVLRQSTIALSRDETGYHFSEYRSPINRLPLGIAPFLWSAACTYDLANTEFEDSLHN